MTRNIKKILDAISYRESIYYTSSFKDKTPDKLTISFSLIYDNKTDKYSMNIHSPNKVILVNTFYPEDLWVEYKTMNYDNILIKIKYVGPGIYLF